MNLQNRVKRLEQDAGDGLQGCQTCAARPHLTIAKEPGAPLGRTKELCPACGRTFEVVTFTIAPGIM